MNAKQLIKLLKSIPEETNIVIQVEPFPEPGMHKIVPMYFHPATLSAVFGLKKVTDFEPKVLI